MSIEKTAITPPQNNPPRPASDVAAIPEPPHGRPKAASAPLGGSAPREAGERGGPNPAAGPHPRRGAAPSGGSGPREAGERGGPICRDYFIAQSATAELLWVYRERPTAADVPPARNGASDRGQRQGQGQGSTSTAGAHAPARWFLHGLYA